MKCCRAGRKGKIISQWDGPAAKEPDRHRMTQREEKYERENSTESQNRFFFASTTSLTRNRSLFFFFGIPVSGVSQLWVEKPAPPKDHVNTCCSVVQSCPTLCDPMGFSTPGFPVLHHLPELAQTHVWVKKKKQQKQNHWVSGINVNSGDKQRKALGGCKSVDSSPEELPGRPEEPGAHGIITLSLTSGSVCFWNLPGPSSLSHPLQQSS